jgi:hypothetical protein
MKPVRYLSTMHIFRDVVLFIAFALASVSANTQTLPEWNSAAPKKRTSVITFRDVIMGSDADLYATRFKSCSQPLEELTEFKLCPDAALDRSVTYAFGDLPVEYLAYYIWRGRVVGFSFRVPAAAFQKLRAMAIDKWGPPTRTEIEPLTYRRATVHQNVVATWETPTGPLVARQYGAQLNTATLEYIDLASAAERTIFLEKRQETARKPL